MFRKALKSRKLPISILIIVTLAQAILTFSFILSHLYELKNSAIDGADFALVLHNLINGNGITTTIPPPYISQNWLGIHFSPILYVIAPIYLLFPHIETLLFLQSFCIAAAAVPLFFTAKIILKSQQKSANWQALVISIFYLINPFVINAQIWDFHEIAFAPLIISFILWAVIARKKLWLVILCAILLTIKEHYGLAVFGTGLLYTWHWKDKKFGLILAAIGLLSFIIILQLIMPHFSLTGTAAMMDNASKLDRFSWLKHPLKNMEILNYIIKNSLKYIVLLLVPFFFFFPLASFVWIFPAAADGAVNILANNDMLTSVFSYHSAAIIPMLLIAYTQTLSKYCNAKTHFKSLEIIGFTAIFSLAFSYNFIALPPLPNNVWEFNKPKFSLPENDKNSVNTIASLIGSEKPVSAQINILPLLPTRREMYVFPQKTDGVEYIILHTDFPYKNRIHVFGTPYWYGDNSANEYFSKANSTIASNEWGVVFYQNNWLLLERGKAGNQVLRTKALQDLQKLETNYDIINKAESLNLLVKP